ncbi:Splicing factor [Oleoguttula sp. CCFEE 5521]
MDINRLLSPDVGVSNAGGPPDDQGPPRKQRRPTIGSQRTSSTLSQGQTLEADGGVTDSRPSPRSSNGPGSTQQTVHYNLISPPGFRPLHPLTANAETSHSWGASSEAPQRPPLAHRQPSHPSSNAQQHEVTSGPQRQTSSSTAHTTSSDSLRSPTSALRSSAAPPVSRGISAQSLADLTMAEAPAQTPPPRSITSSALTEAEAQTVNDLLTYLGEHSFAYDSHVQLINLLHKGFLTHVHGDSGETSHSPHDYGLLAEMRQAREAMDSRFAVGENLWLDWLSDEVIVAKAGDGEARISVMELCQKATQDEPMSVRIWQMYADWIETNYSACNDLPESDQSGWSGDDKELCRELFTRDLLRGVLEKASSATQWRIDSGFVLFNRYMAIAQENLLTAGAGESSGLKQLQHIYVERLKLPSAGWEEVAQMFWPVISKIHGSQWEAAMSHMNELAAPAKSHMASRLQNESRLERFIESGDQTAAFEEFTRCFKWEKKQKKRGVHEKELLSALYERALLRFPTYTEWWLDYVDHVISQMPSSHDPSSSALPLLERATRHCPWSGELWARRILRSDVERLPYAEIEAIKHRATNSSLLDVGGMEEMLQVLLEWSTYLRRNAFTSTSSEDDLDTAEVGIRMAIEDVQQAGRKVYGESFKGDPLYRLEKIHMKFLLQARRVDDARQVLSSLASSQQDSFEFWQLWYHWEILLWGHARLSDSHRVETTETAPQLATRVVEQMLMAKHIDEPEKAMALYVMHYQHNESVESLQAAGIVAREYRQRTSTRRAKEAEEIATRQTQQQASNTMAVDDGLPPANGEKRKRDDDGDEGRLDAKKSKLQDTSPSANGDITDPTAAAAKRDRENCTITLVNVSTDVTEADLKKFFRDCGTMKATTIVPGHDNELSIATVEFETVEDVITAKTRDGKTLNGSVISIRSGSRSTLYVANYPPEYDETAVRKLFDTYGEIISVRFPSLKYDSRRRFCYVQMLSGQQAQAAQDAMDGKMLDGQHRLLAKISDPDAKNRSGASAEGRELFVKNIDFAASEIEVKEFFAQNGTVTSVHLLKRTDGKRLGNGFISFSTSEEARKAVEATNNKPLRDRILHVTIASARGGGVDKARKADIIVKHSTSPEPSSTNGRRASDVSLVSGPHDGALEEAAHNVRERKVAILNLPDTVNDARIRAEMEKYGSINKIQLRRDQNAAIVEFSDIKVAFSVRAGIDCSALGTDVTTGDIAEVFAKGKKGPAAGRGGAGFGGMRPNTVARPGQQRGARRGGLGFKRGGGAPGSDAHEGKSADEKATAAKSNAEFKAMFEKSREEAPANEEVV